MPVVLKIGGSLLESGRMGAVLSIVAGATVPVVVVPGGGPFADMVRELQGKIGFGMAAAHRMAMLAMQQTAEIIAGHDACFTIAGTLEEITEVTDSGDIAVWAPWRLISQDDEVPADWSATSDTLAARLAELLGGAPLVLLKSADVAPSADVGSLSRNGVVDAFFPAIVERSQLRWRILGPADDAALVALLAGEDPGPGL